MTAIEVIVQDIENAPTVMWMAQEQEFCRRLMKVSYDEIISEWALVRKVLDRLHTSHTDAIFEVKSNNDFQFFADWAKDFSDQHPNTYQASDILELAETLVTPFSM